MCIADYPKTEMYTLPSISVGFWLFQSILAGNFTFSPFQQNPIWIPVIPVQIQCGKVDDTRNQHPYIIWLLSLPSSKNWRSQNRFFFQAGNGNTKVFAAWYILIYQVFFATYSLYSALSFARTSGGNIQCPWYFLVILPSKICFFRVISLIIFSHYAKALPWGLSTNIS